MRIFNFRPALLLPLVTAAALAFPAPASATDPVNWRTDYNSARKEATERGLPLFVIVGSENCFYCRKLEGGPLRDAAIVSQIATNFIPLKIDATKEVNLAKALRVQSYPTIVLADHEGKIHAFVEGYVDADRLSETLKRTVATVSTTDWAARDFEQATKALAGSDYPRVVSLLKGIIRESADKPIGVKSQQVLDDVERLAAGRLVQAKELEERGLTQDAMDSLAETVKTYAGTQAASDATARMAGLSSKPDAQEKQRTRAARDLLAAAREEFRVTKLYDCLQKCEQLAAVYGDLPEGKEGAAMAADIRSNPERLAAACEQMNHRTAMMYMTLAEAWTKKGQTADAIACYDKVAKLCPNSRQSDIAFAQMTKLRANNNATTAGLQK